MPRQPDGRADAASTVAMAAFIAAYFLVRAHTVGQGAIDLRPQFWELPFVLGALLLVARARGVELGRVARATWFLLLVVAVGLVMQTTEAVRQSGGTYAYSTALWALYFLVAAAVALVFFDEATFYRLWWRIGMVATVVALLGFVLASTTGTMLLAQYADYGGGLRLTGLLSEPSAWAPVLTSLLLIALRERRVVAGVVILAAVLLSRSPTVILTLGATAAILVLLRPGRVYVKAMIAGALALTAPTIWAVLNDPEQARALTASGNPLTIMLGRVLGGLQFIQTGGQVGSNDRFEGAQDVWGAVTENGWLWTGRGLGSSDVYFNLTVGDFRAYSLPLSILFDLGVLALALYVALAARAIWRLRNRPIGLVLIPFIVATSINSSQGVQFYKFAVLAVLLYGLGWRRVPAPADRAHEASEEPAVARR